MIYDHIINYIIGPKIHRIMVFESCFLVPPTWSQLFRFFFRFPSIADLKLGDIYMIVNFFFVFGTLIEFAIINAQSTSARKRADRAKVTGSNFDLGSHRSFEFSVSSKIDPGTVLTATVLLSPNEDSDFFHNQ